jgi:hypothetical protein
MEASQTGKDFEAVPKQSSTEKREIAMLRILIACGEKALEAFEVSGNPVDAEFVADLERIIRRSRDELAALEPS